MPSRRATLVLLTASALAAGLVACAASPGAGTAAAPAAARDAVRPPAGTKLDVVSAQFGVFGADTSGRRVLFETTNFPAITAAPFGWYIVFKTEKPTVIWREEFELPEAPPTWGPGEVMGVFTISPDRRIAVTERIVPTRVGFIANEWRYAPGDPIGAHAMRVYIDGQLIRDFRFNIEDGPGRHEESPATRGRGPRT